jgi:hypothetical protein
MRAVRADQSAHWLAMGFDELVLTSDIELLRTAFESGVARLRGSDGNELKERGATPYGRQDEGRHAVAGRCLPRDWPVWHAVVRRAAATVASRVSVRLG